MSELEGTWATVCPPPAPCAQGAGSPGEGADCPRSAAQFLTDSQADAVFLSAQKMLLFRSPY